MKCQHVCEDIACVCVCASHDLSTVQRVPYIIVFLFLLFFAICETNLVLYLYCVVGMIDMGQGLEYSHSWGDTWAWWPMFCSWHLLA